MSKFTFICEEKSIGWSNPVSKRTVEFDAVSLDDIVQEFELFLKGCGFYLNGSLEVIPYDEHEFDPNLEMEMYVTKDLPKHSQYYYDTERNK